MTVLVFNLSILLGIERSNYAKPFTRSSFLRGRFYSFYNNRNSSLRLYFVRFNTLIFFQNVVIVNRSDAQVWII